MDRRSFFRTSAAGLAGAAIASSPIALATSCSSEASARKALKLNISFQDKIAPGETLAEKFDFMESLGVTGFEPNGRGLRGRIGEIREALSGRDIRVSAICAGFQGFILAEDPAVKEQFDSSMREIIAAAGELGSVGVIMVPAFNRQTPCKPHTRETREYLVEQLAQLGEYALAHGTTVILEPLNRREAHYLRLVSDAAAICRDTKCEGVKCMGDFWHMSEETSDYAALYSAGREYLRHVHIASRARRQMPGEDGQADHYEEGFRALKDIAYEGFVSFECGTKGDRAVTVPAAVQLLRDQWASVK